MKIIHFDYNTGFSILELDENDEKTAEYLTQDMSEEAERTAPLTFAQALRLMTESMNKAAESIRKSMIFPGITKIEQIPWGEPTELTETWQKAKRSPVVNNYVPEWRVTSGVPWATWMGKLNDLEDAQRVVTAMLDQQDVRPRCPETWEETDDETFPWIYGCGKDDEHDYSRGRIRLIKTIAEIPGDEPEIQYGPESLRIVYTPESLPWGITQWQSLSGYTSLENAKHALEIELSTQALAAGRKGEPYQWFKTESPKYPWVYGISPRLARGRIQMKISEDARRHDIEADEW